MARCGGEGRLSAHNGDLLTGTLSHHY